MKTKLIYLPVLVLMLTGCGSSMNNNKTEEVSRPTLEEILPPKPEPLEGVHSITFGRMTLEIPDRWRRTEDAYLDDETKTAYMLCFEGQDKGLPEEEILKQYIQEHKAETAVPLSDETGGEGYSYRTAVIKYKSGENICALSFYFCHEQEFFAVFKGEAVDAENEQDMIAALTKMSESVRIEPTRADIVSGNCFEVTDVEKFTLDLTENGRFVLSRGDYKANGVRIEGKSSVLRGRDALAALDKYKGKFKTLDIQSETELAYSCEDILDYYVVVLECEDVYRWGNKANTKSYSRLITGIRSGEDTLSMYDYKTYQKQIWKIKEQDKNDN